MNGPGCVKASGACIVETEATQPKLFALGQHGFADGPVEYTKGVFLAGENVGKSKNLVFFYKALHGSSRDFCQVETAELQQLQTFAFGAEYPAGVDFDAQFAFRDFLYPVGHVLHGNVHRVFGVEGVRSEERRVGKECRYGWWAE